MNLNNRLWEHRLESRTSKLNSSHIRSKTWEIVSMHPLLICWPGRSFLQPPRRTSSQPFREWFSNLALNWNRRHYCGRWFRDFTRFIIIGTCNEVLSGRALRQRKGTNCAWCSRVSCNRVGFQIRCGHIPVLDSDTSYLFRPFPSEAVSVSVISHQFSTSHPCLSWSSLTSVWFTQFVPVTQIVN